MATTKRHLQIGSWRKVQEEVSNLVYSQAPWDIKVNTLTLWSNSISKRKSLCLSENRIDCYSNWLRAAEIVSEALEKLNPQDSDDSSTLNRWHYRDKLSEIEYGKSDEERCYQSDTDPFEGPVANLEGPNWAHIKGLSEAREELLNKILFRISNITSESKCRTALAWIRLQATAALRAKKGKLTKRNGKTVIGLNYSRYATAINALADQAESLGFDIKIERLTLKEFKPQKVESESQEIEPKFSFQDYRDVCESWRN